MWARCSSVELTGQMLPEGVAPPSPARHAGALLLNDGSGIEPRGEPRPGIPGAGLAPARTWSTATRLDCFGFPGEICESMGPGGNAPPSPPYQGGVLTSLLRARERSVGRRRTRAGTTADDRSRASRRRTDHRHVQVGDTGDRTRNSALRWPRDPVVTMSPSWIRRGGVAPPGPLRASGLQPASVALPI